MSAEIRRLLEKLEIVAVTEIENGNTQYARGVDDCADQLRALLADLPPQQEAPPEGATRDKASSSSAPPVLALVEAARCIHHWHDALNGEGMVVSASHVRDLWAALAAYDEAAMKAAPPVEQERQE